MPPVDNLKRVVLLASVLKPPMTPSNNVLVREVPRSIGRSHPEPHIALARSSVKRLLRLDARPFYPLDRQRLGPGALPSTFALRWARAA